MLVLLSPSVSGGDTDRQTRTLPLPPGRALSLEITVGQVRIESAPGGDAVIDVVRHGPSAEALTRIPIVIEEDSAEIRVRGVQADGATDPALRTDVTIRVPQHAVLRAVRIVEGGLTLTGLQGAIAADIRRGSIQATNLDGVVRLETGIGHIIDVRLMLEAIPEDARIMALALNGTINSQIPLRTKDTWGPRWGEATLGKGEPVISIDVITGTIEIKVR